MRLVQYFDSSGFKIKINGPVFKIKEYHTFDMVVLGYVNGYTENYSLMKEILVGVMTEENQYLVTGVVANGFDIDQREKLSKNFDKIKVNSNSIIVSGARIPFTMIKPTHVVILLIGVVILKRKIAMLVMKQRML